MRYATCAVLLFTSLPALTRAEEALSPQMVTELKAATVFVKIKSGELAGSGSGFVIRVEGNTAYIVTNRHVVEPKVAEIAVVPERRSRGPQYGYGGRRGVPGFPQPMVPQPMVPPFPFAPGAQEEEPGYSVRVLVRELKNVDVTAVFQSGTTQEDSVPGKLVAVDPDEDLAVIKVSGVKQPPATIQYRPEPHLTETMPVYVFGFPLGEELSTSKRSPAITIGRGTVSSLRTDDDGNLSVVQLDASLNHGNSGGPVVDARGRLVGVAAARIAEEGAQNLGFAIPSRALARLLQGRLGKAVLRAVKDGDNRMTVKVTAALIDPLNKIKSARLHYLNAAALADRPKPSDPLEALSGCHTLDLKLENGIASGTISVKEGVTQVSLLHQVVSIDESGKRAVSKSAVKRLALAPPPRALPPAANPSAVVTGQKAPAAAGGSIGIHFIGTGSPFRGTGGVVPMSNWNNEAGASFNEVALVDNSGANSGATFSLVDAVGTGWATGSRNELLNGYVSGGNFQPMTLTVKGIPYARYSIYVCVGDCTLGCAGKVIVRGTTYYYTPMGGEPVGYTQVTSTNPAMHQLGNYIEVDGLSGASQTVVMAGTTQQYSGLCSVEIVDTSSAAGNKKAPPAVPSPQPASTGPATQRSSVAPPAISATSATTGPSSQGAAGARPRLRHGLRPAVQPGDPAVRAGEPEQIFGGRFSPQFRDVAPTKGLLVGFEVGLGKWGSSDVISALRPIYLDGQGKEVLGEQHGTVNGQAIRVRAKQGYAVGAITVKSMIAIDGFSLTFMKIGKDRLDPADKYESDWFGGKGGMPETTVGGKGSPAIGIVGHCNDKDCTAIGIVFAPAKAGE